MATANTDICNRALILLGSQSQVLRMNQDSVEAKILNSIYTPVTNWCLTLTNWNFARKTVALGAPVKTAAGPGWSSADPAPGWQFEFTLPADFLRAVYITNDAFTNALFFDGEPQRFVMANDTVTAVSQEVLLANTNPAILVYTSQMNDPTLWPLYFERLAVAAVAWTVSPILSPHMVEYLDQLMERFFVIAEQNNREEGLMYGDTTPEWIQAVGINYPTRRRVLNRLDRTMATPPKEQPK